MTSFILLAVLIKWSVVICLANHSLYSTGHIFFVYIKVFSSIFSNLKPLFFSFKPIKKIFFIRYKLRKPNNQKIYSF